MLPMVSQSDQLTMSSREIAEMTKKEHKNVIRTIESLMSAQILTAQIEPLKYLHRGNTYKYYELCKRDSLVLVARLSPEFTAAVIDRWQWLEGLQQPKPQLPQTFAEALQLAADQAKQLELQAPKVAFVEKLVERDNLLTATQVAQKHGKSAIWLNKILDQHDVYNKNVKRSRVFRQRFIDKGFGKMKQNDSGHDQPLFTNAGEVWINELLIAHGYV